MVKKMELEKEKKEMQQGDDNSSRNIDTLDPHPLPAITDWYRRKAEKRDAVILFL